MTQKVVRFRMRSIHEWTYEVYGARSLAEAVRVVSTRAYPNTPDLDYDQNEESGQTLDSTAELLEITERA